MTPELSSTEIEELGRLADGATPGTWLVARNGKQGGTFRIWRNDNAGGLPNDGYACISSHVVGEANAQLFAAARNTVPQLCRLALRLMDERDQKIETTGGAEARIVSIQTDDEAWIKLLNERNQRVIESMK